MVRGIFDAYLFASEGYLNILHISETVYLDGHCLQYDSASSHGGYHLFDNYLHSAIVMRWIANNGPFSRPSHSPLQRSSV